MDGLITRGEKALHIFKLSQKALTAPIALLGVFDRVDFVIQLPRQRLEPEAKNVALLTYG